MTAADDRAARTRGSQPNPLWDLEDRQEKPVRPALTVGRIADAAIELADADGMPAVSMQQVAARLQVTKMALYRHVASKAELVAVMTERAVGISPELSKVPGGWRPRLLEWARQMRETWRRHPWLPEATVGQRPMGPREIGWTESAVAAFDGTGLDGAQRMDAVFLVSGHLRNTHSMATAGTQPWTAERGLKPVIKEHAERFPALAEAVERPSADNGWEFGLHRILDGLAVFIDQRRITG